MNLFSLFHPNRTMRKCLKLGRKVWRAGRDFEKKLQMTQVSSQNEYVASSIQIRQRESVQNQGERFGGDVEKKIANTNAIPNESIEISK